MDRTGDMLKMIEDFLFADAQGLGNLTQVQRLLFQERGDFFTDRWHGVRTQMDAEKTG